MPMPNAVPSISRPSARAKSPLPSESMRSPAGTCWLSPQACITKGSLTAMQATSMPRSLNSSKRSTKPGRWCSEQVGVKAPGTANSTTFLCANRVGVSMVCTPPSICLSVTSGMASPIWMGMGGSVWAGRRRDRSPRAPWCHAMAAGRCRRRTCVAPLRPDIATLPRTPTGRGGATGDRMQFKDYYAILGVEPGAGDAEIKTAYRRLARKYHPDVSKEAGAEDKFKSVNEAYEALRDPERRKAYDQLRSRGYQPGDDIHPPPGGFGGGSGGGPGFDYEEVFGSGGGGNGGFSDFFESLFRRQAQQRGGPGFGTPPRGDTRARLVVPLETVHKGGAMRIAVNGRTLDVKVPRGIRPGQVIRLAGLGERGGNLLLEVEYGTHPRFEVDE